MSRIRVFLAVVAAFTLSPFATADVQLRKSTVISCYECNGVWADFNGDGLDDFLVRHPGTLHLNLGGRLGPPIEIGVQTSLDAVQRVADFNGDGLADLMTYGVPQMVDDQGNYGPEGPSRLLLGDGTGRFSERSMPPGKGNIIAMADYTGDGVIDVLRWDFPNKILTLLRGNGDATFAVHQSLTWPFEQAYSNNFVPADVNGDGRLDIVVPHEGYLGFLFARPDGQFDPVRTRFTRMEMRDAHFADVNGDAKADLIFNEALHDSGVTVLIGDGTGRFPGVMRYVVPGSGHPLVNAGAVEIRVGDFVPGGSNEIAVAERGQEGGHLTILAAVNGQLAVVAKQPVESPHPYVEVARFTRDTPQIIAWGQWRNPTAPRGERLNYTSWLIETEGTMQATTAASRRRGRAIGRHGFTGGRYHVSVEGDCPVNGLRNWTLVREGMFVDIEESPVIERADAVFLDGEVFMRLHVKDGNATRILEGTLQITDLGLSGKLFEWGDSPCGQLWALHRVEASLSH